MNEFVTRTRKDKMREQRHCNVKKRVLAIIEMILITSLLVASVYFFLDKTKAKATMEEHTVQKGETLISISTQYHMTIKDIQRINKLESNKIEIGQKLLIPEQNPPSYHVVKKGETVYSIAQLYGLPIKELKKQNQLTSNKILIGQVLSVPKQDYQNNQLDQDIQSKITSSDEPERGISEFYTIVPGDTLWSLSERFGVPFAKLKRVNHLNTNHIQANQKLYIPDEKYFATAIVIGAADNTTVEFYVHGEPLPLKVSHGTSILFQKITNQEVFITYKNGALVSFH